MHASERRHQRWPRRRPELFRLELNQAFGDGWSISNNFIFDGGYLNTHALVNNGNPKTVSAYIQGLTWPTALTPGAVQAVYPDGLAVDPNQSVITEQVWLVQKKLTNAIDEFRLNKEVGDGNTLTLGCIWPTTRQRQLVVGRECADEQSAECEPDHLAGRRGWKSL